MTDDYLQQTRWSLGDVLLVLLGGFVAAQLVAIPIVLALGSSPGAFWEIGVLVTVQSAGSFGVMGLLSYRKGSGDWLTDYGFVMRPADLWALFLGFGLTIVVSLVTVPLIDRFAPDSTSPQQAITSIAQGADGLPTEFLIIASVGVLAPIVEECVWRGMVLSRLLRSMARPYAVVVQAFFFAALHWVLDPGSYLIVPGLFLTGVALGVLAVRSGTLSLSIFTHAGFNLTSTLLLLYGDALLEYADETTALIRHLR